LSCFAIKTLTERRNDEEDVMRKSTTGIFFSVLAALLVGIAAHAAEEYQLGAGDSVKITVYNNADLTTEARIDEDGSIPFPLVGRVPIGGLTKAAAEQRIAKLLTDGGFLKQAAINLSVTDYRSQQVSVLGEVGKPGKYPISSATTVMDILAQAGGITDKGSSSIRLVQHDKSGATRERNIDLDQLVAAKGGADLTVRHGDVIFVSAQPVFYIYGEVQKPGVYPLTRDMTVRQAIAMGGGLTVRGTERGLKVSRRNDAGAIEVHRVKLNEPLSSGDVVQVKESLF
jgi:polysaccharide export outer membrane protein